MGLLKNLTVAHKREVNGNYSVFLQKCPSFNQPALIFEAGAIVSLNADEANSIRRENTYTKVLDAYASLGVLQDSYEESKSVLYLVLVVGCSSVGKILNSEIFRITDVEIILLNGPGDQDLIKDVRRLLSSGSFYFSHSTAPNQPPYDLTLSSQRSLMTKNTDHRFFWNRILFRHFERFNISTSTWLVKVISGGLNINTVYIGGIQAKACLFSRLSCERAGTRFNVRGVNDQGHVANFVETEQVIFINRSVYSCILIRGSIPLFWDQPGIQVGSHRIKMSRGSEISQSAYDKHMFLLRERYQDVTVVNLLSLKDSELLLNQLFNAHHQASNIGSKFKFLNFDYHALCPRGHKEELERFYLNELDHYCEKFGFMLTENDDIKQLQSGVIRVNCLDCLDRTNSVQSYIGLKMLEKFICTIEKIEVGNILPRLKDIYTNMWVNNGDQISKIYAGTGALEGKNVIKDGALSVARTIQNNLFDSDKQSAMDVLVLGRAVNKDYSYRSQSLLPYYYMYAPPNLLVKICDRYLDFCVPEKLKIVVGTWNVNGGKHFNNLSHSRARPLSDWLVDYRAAVEYGSGDADLINQHQNIEPIDVYVIGFQEIVDLNATNIVAASSQNQRDWLLEITKSISNGEHHYLLINSVQLVGVCLFVFIRAPLAPFIVDVNSDQVKTGLGGATGNKGAVAVRFRYKATSFCFICAHFSAGQNQTKERNDDYAEITRRLQFSMNRLVNSHDYIFWCGDFNYRLDKISNDEARRAAALGDYKLLLQHDQLKLSQVDNKTFRDYIEGDINFAPTYKYDAFSNDYDSSEKCRMPAYTDRILFKKRHETIPNEVLTSADQIKFYNRVELLSSDHRPVVAEFEVEALEVDKNTRREVIDEVLSTCGPLDSTVTVQIEGAVNISDEGVVTAILRLFADEAGEIVLVRLVSNFLVIIFRDGESALKALHLNDASLEYEGYNDTRLIIDLKTPNWRDAIHFELTNNMDNTINFVNGNGPSMHIEDDEDEAAQELNLSLGPEVNSESFCLINAMFAPPEKEIPVVTPSPEPPKRPPPPTKQMKPPTRAPPPVPLNQSSPVAQAERELVEPNLYETQYSVKNGRDYEGEGENDQSISFVDLSATLDFEELPPPTIKPPTLPPLTPSRLPPAIPTKPPVASPSVTTNTTTASTRAPPPPIPARTGIKE